MNTQITTLINEASATMTSSVEHLEKGLKAMRAGKASPQMLAGVKVDYYGTLTPIEQVGNVNTPAANQIVIQPWDKGSIPAINKAILDANLGFTPKVEADLLRITLPPLTEDRRKELVKSVKSEGENAKVSVRNIRRNILDKVKKTKDSKENPATEDEIKQAEKEIQDLTDKFIKNIDSVLAEKEKELMTI
ncbi:MAG: ribosome recycling factor [Bacteroidales bacterium]|nr:ribosome recycling factor [Bacteroidales bacterium]